MDNFSVLGELTPQKFLRDYWHKRPLLIRQAIPEFKPLLSREALCEMAAQDDVESRLITHFDGNWQMQSGPMQRLPSSRKKEWTLLVQGVNLHNDAADALLQRFRFIPDARLDDLMISYATDQGGVGPHFDSYDVFLLQVHGRRRWKISAQDDLDLVDGMPLKILKNFQQEEEYVLEPGDMLYLPPHYAHDGIAEGECMTYSIGFRAPPFQELGEAFLQFMADSIDLPGRYADPALATTKHPAEISRDMISVVAAELEKIRFTNDDVTIFLGEYLTEPKANVFFDAPAKPLSPAKFVQAAQKKGIRLSRKTRMLYRGRNVFVNGESFSVSASDKKLLAMMADSRSLSGAEVAMASTDVMEALTLWYEDGWIIVS